MKKLLVFALVLTGFVFASCQKDEAPQPEQKVTSKVSDKKDTTGWD